MTKNIDNVPAEYRMQVSGREHVTFDGLVHMAHAAGLVGTDTELLQAPTEANKGTAIVRAVATFRREDGSLANFSGIGDANPANTNKVIGLHAIRMAETRALARALRVALNIKGCAFEELGGEGTPAAQPAAPAPTPAAAEPPATDEQKAKIAQGCDRLGWDDDKRLRWLVKRFNKNSRKLLTHAEAEVAITELRERINAAKAGATTAA